MGAESRDVLRTIDVVMRELVRSEAAADWSRFTGVLSSVGPSAAERLLETRPDWLEHGPALRRRYGAAIRIREIEAARRLLDPAVATLRRDEFAARAYARVADMFDQVEFRSCARFVMVGCGPLPVTMLHVHDRTSVADLVGLDQDPEAASIAGRVLSRWAGSRARARATHIEGAAFDFADAQVVYVANLVERKSTVLSRVADTAAVGTTVILREPFALGRLLAERALDGLDPRFEITGHGPGDTGFLSKHVFLALRGDG